MTTDVKVEPKNKLSVKLTNQSSTTVKVEPKNKTSIKTK